MAEKPSPQSTGLQGQYRSPGFETQMGQWRDAVTEDIRRHELAIDAVEAQIAAGTVAKDDYTQIVRDRTYALHQEVAFIDSEISRW